ncbi:MAG: transporter substrate-binding domain-containing protein [Gammaproteobacteria bacterium]|nr:transporter substrate-binding domain-containing protein [Gammaproteobacteria bacterium]
MRKVLITVAAVLATAIAVPAFSDSITDRIENGEPIRLGFANEVPWAYPGENNEPLGFVNAFVLGVLGEMGYDRDDLEPVVTEWGGLIPGLQANRFDIVTGGMYILSSRCENIAFSDPMAEVADAFLVAPGNPKNIHNYEDIREADAVLVTGAGYNTVEDAKSAGVPESNIMTVPGPTEILAAVRAGRADAGGGTYFTVQNLAAESGGEVEVSDPAKMPKDLKNWVGIGFRKSDTEFLEQFNAAMADYLGSDAMLEAVAEYGYTASNVPGDDASTEWACENR